MVATAAEPRHYLGQVRYSPTKTLDYDLYYVTSDDEVPAIVEWLRGLPAVGLDLETDKLDKKRSDPHPFYCGLATLQLGYPKGDHPCAYVIDVRCVSAEALAPLLKLLESPALMKLGMNIEFECEFLQHNYGVRLKNVADIQIAELLLRAGLFPEKEGAKEEGAETSRYTAYGATSMAKLARRHLHGLDIDKDKELRTSFFTTPPGEHSERQITYAAEDTLLPFFIAKKQRREIDERGLGHILDIEFALIPILADARLTGMFLDQGAWRQLWQEAQQRRATAEKKLDEHFTGLSGQNEFFAGERPTFRTGKPLNYDSPAHIRWALASYCKTTGWPVEVVTSAKRVLELKKEYGQGWFDWLQRKNKKKKIEWDDVPERVIDESKHCILISANKDVLKLSKIKQQLPAELVDLLIEYAEQSQRADSFGIEFINKHVNKRTRRIHPMFHQLIASTGRLSTQPNSQNIPRDARYRACFKPAKGYKYVIADYSQIEPRLSAEVSLDPVYVTTFLDDDDIYCRVAEAMTGTYPDKKTEEGKVLRQVFKTIVLALAYRMGWYKLRNRLILALEKEIMSGKVPLPDEEYVKELHRGFLEKCEKIREYQELCQAMGDSESSSARKFFDPYLGDLVTYVEAPCGRKRFFRPKYRKVYTEGPNAPIQGCSATITKLAAVMVQAEIDKREWDAHIVDLVHDEIVWEVREDQAVEFAEVAKHLMEEAGRKYIKHVPVKAEFPKGTNGVVDCWLKEAA